MADKIDWSKPVQTRDGREVVIHTTEGLDNEYPVIGEVSRESGRGWNLERWTMEGEYLAGEADPECDLINVPEKVRGWVAVPTEDFQGPPSTRLARHNKPLPPCPTGHRWVYVEETDPPGDNG